MLHYWGARWWPTNLDATNTVKLQLSFGSLARERHC
jgi:hypothetical protein